MLNLASAGTFLFMKGEESEVEIFPAATRISFSSLFSQLTVAEHDVVWSNILVVTPSKDWIRFNGEGTLLVCRLFPVRRLGRPASRASDV